jgi:6-phosphofructokinase
VQAEAGRQPTVERGGRPATLDVPEYDGPRLVPRAGLDLGGEPFADAPETHVAEGVLLARDQGHATTGHEARAVVLGHIQRGGTPTAFDRWLATRFGLHAIAAVRDGDFGTMMALRGTDIVRVPLIEGTGELKLVQPDEYAEAEVFFG